MTYINPASTLTALLTARADARPAMKVYRWLTSGETEGKSLSFKELDERARAIAGKLQSCNIERRRALLLYGPGLEFVEALFGCLYAGIIAVPAYLPGSTRDHPRLGGILQDADCGIVLTTSESLERTSQWINSTDPNAVCLATDVIDSTASFPCRVVDSKPGDIAYLQYTSGSTSAPKGVMITHGNILENLKAIAVQGDFTDDSVSVSWLPHFHDMGLIYGILQPLFNCFPVLLMSPASFLHRPLRWLRAISHYRGTHCGGPNFAYDLCVDRISREEVSTLDLSSWRIAFNGAEPIRSETLERFARHFTVSGFRRTAFYPVYGLAEASLKVTSVEPGTGAIVCAVDPEQIAQGSVQPADPADSSAYKIVCCGRASPEHEVVIVDPESCAPCAPDKVGEIWVAGPSVAAGYWNNPDETQGTFRAFLSDGRGPYLRTGDLGFVHADNLFIAGRIKDCIIIRGKNHYPQDIEKTVEASHPALRRHGAAAFAVQHAGQEKLAVVAEMDRKHRDPLESVLESVRRTIAESHELQVHAIVLIKAGSLPKTSSGKVQRQRCKQKFLAEELPVLARFVAQCWEKSEVEIPRRLFPGETASARRDRVEAYLSHLLSHILQRPLTESSYQQPLVSLGIDSLAGFDLLGKLEADLAITLPIEELLDESISSIATQIINKIPLSNGEEPRRQRLKRMPRPLAAPLSASQQQVWFLQQLYPESCAYNEHLVIHLTGQVELKPLERAISEIIRRHEVLRTVFRVIDGSPCQCVEPARALELPVVLLESGRQLRAELESIVRHEVRRAFDLQQHWPVRFTLLKAGSDESVLLLVAHHIVCDGSSLGIFARELGTLYGASLRGEESPLPDLSIQYADYAVWQQEMLQAEKIGKQLLYWREQLADLPLLDLPADHPRPPVQQYDGSVVSIELPGDVTSGFNGLVRQMSVTPFMGVLTAFQILLSKYTGQSDFAIGTAVANRRQAEIKDLIGFFVNTLVLRAGLECDLSFMDVLAGARNVARAAYAHQEIPFEKLVEELQPERDLSRSPLFQVMLVFQSQLEEMEFSGLKGSFPLTHAGISKFDLTLRVIQTHPRLHLVFEYSQGLFEHSTIQRMPEHLRLLMEQVIEKPQQRIGELVVLTNGEQQQILVDWNQTAVQYPFKCMHELFANQAARTPYSPAIQDEEHELTYIDLHRRSNQLAHFLRNLGVKPEVRVGICMGRGIHMVVGLLGVLKAGGAYVPLDPAYPAERLQFMVQDAQVHILLTEKRFETLITNSPARKIYVQDEWAQVAAEPNTDLETKLHPDNLAYVIYTSGSTGRPKGVGIQHRGASVLMHWARDVFTAEEFNGVLASTSICFDLSVFEIFVPLSWGGNIIIAANALELPKWFASDKVRLINTVPSAMAELIRMKGVPPSVQVVNLAGEALHPSLVNEIYQTTGTRKVCNLYGPSEDTTYSTWVVLEKHESGIVGIGRPIANTQVYVLDQSYQPVPVGVAGELYMGGAGLARGYLNRPELTAVSFVAHPFSKQPGERLYRTGDRVRWKVDGSLEFLGRLDRQVKVRGYRIELGEIEAALLKHEDVEQAAVIVREDSPGDQRLVAYVSSSNSERINKEELRESLRVRVPEYMIPAVIVELKGLPLTPNGKIDRKSLPKPDQTFNEYSPLSTATEELLATIWAGVLKVDSVGATDNFFSLGGHSLLATQVISRIHEVFGIELPIRSLFESPALSRFASRIDEARGTAHPSRPSITKVSRQNDLPLSYAQQRLWFLDQLEPGNVAYNMAFGMCLTGDLHKPALQNSLNEIIHRHEALRTTFDVNDGLPVQRISPELEIAISEGDLSGLPAVDREREAHRQTRAEALSPFDLTRGPLLRAKLLRLAEQEHLLLFTMHHIISDGWSVGLMMREFSSLYAAYSKNEQPDLPELDIQYADYAVWQRSALKYEVLAQQLEYWKKQLFDVPALELPMEKPRPVVMGRNAQNERVHLPSGLAARLRELNRSEGVTMFMTLLTAFNIALADFSGQKDLAIGTPIANRYHVATERLIGLFVNTLVLRSDLNGNITFKELLGRTREMVLEAHAHQDLPFERLVEELAPKRDLSRTPLFQVMLSMQNTEHEQLQLPGLRLSGFTSENQTAKFDLLLLAAEGAEGITGDLSYASDLYESHLIQRFLQHWQFILEKMSVDPELYISELPLLAQTEQEQILKEWNQRAAGYPSLCMHELFELQVKRTPQAMAVQHHHGTLTYARLNRQANQLAHYLKKLGVGQEICVGICIDRSLDMVVALLGVLKAGGAYVPLDPAYPEERLRIMMEDSQAAVLITQASLKNRIQAGNTFAVCLDEERNAIAHESSENGTWLVQRDGLAYVIYTSGSTGKPKGVAIQHSSAAAMLHWARDVFSDEELSGVLASTSICFDLSVFEIFVPLSWGGKVIMADNALELPRWKATSEVKLVNTVPSAMRELVRMNGVPASVTTVNLAGEALQESLVKQIYQMKNVQHVLNLYGPSEDTTYSTYVKLKRGAKEEVSIGKPITNSQAYVLDTDMRPVLPGVKGELWLGGQGLARGYLGKPHLTAERFLPDPFGGCTGQRLYRTGDEVRWRTDGNLEFLGRLDHQVKLRGFRIEMGEIETALLEHPSVGQATVMMRAAPGGDKLLAAYIVTNSQTLPGASELRDHLKQKLPDYMIPAAYVFLDRLPRTPNGKLDRKALPQPEAVRREYVAPNTPVQETLAAIWAEVLKVDRPGITDNFFEMGGHSLLATQLISRIRETFQVELPLKKLFEQPTIEMMSHYIAESSSISDEQPQLVAVSREAYRVVSSFD